jgi:hypothetical protein
VSAQAYMLQGVDVPFTVGHSDGIVLESSGMDRVKPESKRALRLVGP